MNRRLAVLLAGPVIAALLVAWLYSDPASVAVPGNPNPGPSPASRSSTAVSDDDAIDAADSMQRYHLAFASESSAALSSALEDLADLSQSYDLAVDMSEAGLYTRLVDHLGLCLNSTTTDSRCLPAVQSRIAMALGAAAHNHPVVSARLAYDGAVLVLAGLVRSGVHSGVHRGLQALASLFRAHPPSARDFVTGRGEYGGDPVALMQAAAAKHPLRALRVVEQLLDVKAGVVSLPCEWQDVVGVALQVGCRHGDDDDDVKRLAVTVADAIQGRCAPGHGDAQAPENGSSLAGGRGSE